MASTISRSWASRPSSRRVRVARRSRHRKNARGTWALLAGLRRRGAARRSAGSLQHRPVQRRADPDPARTATMAAARRGLRRRKGSKPGRVRPSVAARTRSLPLILMPPTRRRADPRTISSVTMNMPGRPTNGRVCKLRTARRRSTPIISTARPSVRPTAPAMLLSSAWSSATPPAATARSTLLIRRCPISSRAIGSTSPKPAIPMGPLFPNGRASRRKDQRYMALGGTTGPIALPNKTQLDALSAYYAWRKVQPLAESAAVGRAIPPRFPRRSRSRGRGLSIAASMPAR